MTIPLTYYQVKKIQQMVTNGSSLLQANFELNISTNTVFGNITFNKRLFSNIEVRSIP
ncbi:MAG: hypothetical protein Q8M94_05025 [Ignavibacteria bacterium]|nr:hypothetical protein [Ignavibacteria bacterium]